MWRWTGEGDSSVHPLQGLVELTSPRGVATKGLREHTEHGPAILWSGTSP